MPGEVAESPGPPDPPAQPSPPGPPSPPSPSMAVPVNTALARRPMKKESGVNLDFRNWARSLPTDRRNEIIQKIVSRRVIGNTSAKTAVKKLSAKAVVRLEKLDVLRCVINHYAQHRSATPSSESVQEVVPVRIKSPTKVAFEKPCPLSRKRRLTMQSPHIQDKQPKLIDLSEENVKDKEPDTPAVDGLPQRLENCQKVTATPSCSGETPKKCADDTAVVRSESAKQPALSRSLPVRSESPLKQISSSSQAETPTAEHLESSRPGETIPPKKQSASMVQKSQQPPLLTARIIDSEIADVALAIAATETELVKLHEQLVSFERLGPSSKKNTRTINALLESSAILENKAKCVKSCVDKGVMRKLGNAFYPRLLQEVQKNQKLNLYSNMRLMSMVNMLLGLSLPNSDPRHTLSAFVAKSLYDQRPRAQGTTEAAPRILPVKPAAQVSVIMENTTQPSCSQPPVPVASRRENSINQVPHDFNHRSQAPPGPQPHPSVTVGQVVSNLVTSHVRASQVENQMNGMEQLTTFQHVMKTMPQQVANSNSGNYVIMPSQKTGNQVILASSQVQVSQVFSKGPSQPQVRTAQLTETTQRLYPPQLQQSQQAVFQQQHYQQQDSPQQIQQQLHQMQLQQRQLQQRELQQRQLQQPQLQQQQALQKQPLQLTQQLQQQFQPNQLPQQPQQLQQRPLQHHFQLQQQQLQQQQFQQQQFQQQQFQQQQLKQQRLKQQQLQQQQLQLHQAPQLPVQQQYQTNQQITAPQFQQHLYVQVQQPFVHGFQTQQFQLQPQNIVSHQTYTQVQERGQPVNAVLSGGVPFRQSGVQVIPNVSPVARATSRDSGIETPELHWSVYMNLA